MTDNKDAPKSDANRAADAPGQAGAKRPHATLDIKATEIKDADKTQAKAASASAASSSSAADKASGASAAAGLPPPASATKASQTSQRPSEPAPAKRSGGALSHLAAGLVGGAIALAGAQYLLPRAPINSLDQAALNVKAAETEERLAALETDQKKVSELSQKVGDNNGRLNKLDGLETLVVALNEQQGKLASDAAAISEKLATGVSAAERVGKLEERLNLIAAQDGGDGKLPQLAALTAKMADIEGAVAKQIAELNSAITTEIDKRTAQVADAGTQKVDRDVGALRNDTARLGQRMETSKADTDRISAALQALQEETGKLSSAMGEIRGMVEGQLKGVAKPADIAAAVAPVAGKITALEQDLKTVVKSEDDRKANAERIVLALELANLKRALDRGQPYATELTEVRKAAGGKLDLAALERYKEEGVETLPELESEFRSVMHAVIDADEEPADGSVVERLISSAKSVVRVRKISHEADDASAEAAVARMDAALKEGRLGDVIEASKAIPRRAAAPIEGWLEKVTAKHAADQAMATVEGQLKSSLSGTAPPPPPSRQEGNSR